MASAHGIVKSTHGIHSPMELTHGIITEKYYKTPFVKGQIVHHNVAFTTQRHVATTSLLRDKLPLP